MKKTLMLLLALALITSEQVCLGANVEQKIKQCLISAGAGAGGGHGGPKPGPMSAAARRVTASTEQSDTELALRLHIQETEDDIKALRKELDAAKAQQVESDRALAQAQHVLHMKDFDSERAMAQLQRQLAAAKVKAPAMSMSTQTEGRELEELARLRHELSLAQARQTDAERAADKAIRMQQHNQEAASEAIAALMSDLRAAKAKIQTPHEKEMVERLQQELSQAQSKHDAAERAIKEAIASREQTDATARSVIARLEEEIRGLRQAAVKPHSHVIETQTEEREDELAQRLQHEIAISQAKQKAAEQIAQESLRRIAATEEFAERREAELMARLREMEARLARAEARESKEEVATSEPVTQPAAAAKKPAPVVEPETPSEKHEPEVKPTGFLAGIQAGKALKKAEERKLADEPIQPKPKAKPEAPSAAAETPEAAAPKKDVMQALAERMKQVRGAVAGHDDDESSSDEGWATD